MAENHRKHSDRLVRVKTPTDACQAWNRLSEGELGQKLGLICFPKELNGYKKKQRETR